MPFWEILWGQWCCRRQVSQDLHRHFVHLLEVKERLGVIALENEGECRHGGRRPEGTPNLSPETVLRHLIEPRHEPSSSTCRSLLPDPNTVQDRGKCKERVLAQVAPRARGMGEEVLAMVE